MGERTFCLRVATTMMLTYPVAAAFLSFLPCLIQAGSYRRAEHIVGNDFFHAFDWDAIPDPTNGRVNYTDKATARALHLTTATKDKFILRSDATTVLDPLGPGRNSVRLVSKRAYRTHVTVHDIAHMPTGCGTWPAVWEFGGEWPGGGEVDILEGVNDQGPNQSALHTGPNCTMPAERDEFETGTPIQIDCDATHNFNQGCVVQTPSDASYGPAFNEVGGGWYAMERTERFVKVWFWPRDSHAVPRDVRGVRGGGAYGALGYARSVLPKRQLRPLRLGAAQYYHQPHPLRRLCRQPRRLRTIRVSLNLYRWALLPSFFDMMNMHMLRADFVNANPAALRHAYFEFNSVSVYTRM
ncbi:Glycoside hydrolase family 16 protein [Mycena kentingensis (nom. inval.)]|nr:Glycoside hydrolase family 16 protein [Mycena kentingensis (nom. inval.)]